MSKERLEAAVAAAVLPAEEDFAELLRSIVVVARAIFGAQASSVLLFEEETDELVFAAVANEREQHLVGQRFPSSKGIAGWVLSARTPLVLSFCSAGCALRVLMVSLPSLRMMMLRSPAAPSVSIARPRPS